MYSFKQANENSLQSLYNSQIYEKDAQKRCVFRCDWKACKVLTTSLLTANCSTFLVLMLQGTIATAISSVSHALPLCLPVNKTSKDRVHLTTDNQVVPNPLRSMALLQNA